MKYSQLTKGHCVPCEGGTMPLSLAETKTYLSLLKTSWVVEKNLSIKKEFKFKDFKEAMRFVNKVAEIAESEAHHPDLTISYNKVGVKLTTHAIGGLSTNDFILASKIEQLH